MEQASSIDRELYLSLLIDRADECACFVGSAAGGMDIEEVARVTPEKIARVKVRAATGIMPYAGRRLAKVFGLEDAAAREMHDLAGALYRLFDECDASLIEINPLVVNGEGKLLALDAKMTFDDNALFRHSMISEFRDKSQEDPNEMEAADRGLSYVGLEGNIGCIVNGAGLAMATMDIIKLRGGEPANFMDIGGGASPSRVAKAFRLVLSDPKVKAILVNIFAGINRCDWVAEGVIEAVRRFEPGIPVVVRLSGTNMDEGLRMIRESGLQIQSTDTLDGAVKAAVESISEKG